MDACIIKFQDGLSETVTGTLNDVQEALQAGGLVQFTDPWDRQITVNAANVNTVAPIPGGIGKGDD